MNEELAYGIIPASIQEGVRKFFLVQHRKDAFWGFPKGHAEHLESPQAAAERELHEETGLVVLSYMRQEPFIEKYSYVKQECKINKTVWFYLAKTTENFCIDMQELIDGRWLTLAEIKAMISFPEGKKLALEVEEFFLKLS